MTIFGFANAEYQFMDSSVFGYWSDQDGYPVSARNYAHEVFAYNEELEETPANIIDELNDYFGKGQWRIEYGSDGVFNRAVAVDTESVFPFIVRRRITVTHKHYASSLGWVESPYPIPTEEDYHITPLADWEKELLNDCD